MSNELPDVADGVSYDPETDMYRATFNTTASKPSVAVVKALANVCGEHPAELAPLYESIDPNALDQFLMTPAGGQHDGDRKAAFTFQNHSVTLLSCGLIKVQPETTADSIEE